MTEQFRNMTIYELLWPEDMTQTPNVEVVKSKKPVLELCSDLIGKYREGNGKSTVVNGEGFTAREAVFYINSVSEIKKIIKKNGSHRKKRPLSVQPRLIIFGNWIIFPEKRA